ncbi:unnamed protein product [Bemisia tabaci]|uniref:FACT complex subunit SSRP1 n=1 Tax=Bemisia tabaci TaxID=7038 RepID=A0A9P0FA24_BEMTA|nr:PREDICTED: FACT complex subunit Ssrp1-like [Bemisia tabaci]CAH0395894.1 unnamed protein product [Bemisia tabaci]
MASKDAGSDTDRKKDKDWSIKGWNWGACKFNGPILTFEVDKKPSFEIPLDKVSQCMTGKNEVTIEFHQNEEAPVSLMEMRFHIPPAELAGAADPVEEFHDQVMQKASVISVSGDAIAIFREIPCVTPRGRYDIKMFQTFFQLHGKTFDYKIPMTTVQRLFLLPHKDGRQKFFVVSLDPPIKQGQTRYPFIVFTFNSDDEEISIELPLSEEELKEKYDGKLSKELSGQTYDVLGSIMKVMTNTKITVPGNFIGASGTPAVGCSYKAAAGYLYPLERGFMFVHKPPMHIRFEEISSVNFARGAGSMTRSFDFEVSLKSGWVHTFSSIDKGEYGKLFDYVSTKKLVVKDSSKGAKVSYKESMDDSGDEGEPDAYLARVKREAKERDDDGDDDDESDDEDFNPGEEGSDVAEEYDSNPSTTSDSGDDSETKEKKKKKKEKKKKEQSEDDEVTPDDDEDDDDDDKKSKKKKDTKKRKPAKEKEPKEKKGKKPAGKKASTESPTKYKSKEIIEDEDSTDSD